MRKHTFITAAGNRVTGMTLVEIVIALAISLLAVISILSIFIASGKMSVEAFLRNKSAMEARTVIDNLTTDIRTAVGLESSFGGYSASSKVLILKVPAIDANGIPIDIESKYDRIIYHPDNDSPNDLMRTVLTDASSARVAENRVIGSSSRPQIGVQGTFTTQPDALGAFVVHYEFTSVQSRAGKDYELPVAGSVRLRNKL